MIQSILLCASSGTWTTSRSAILSAVEGCGNMILQLQAAVERVTAHQDSSFDIELFKESIEVIKTRVTSFQLAEISDDDRRVLLLLLVKVSLAVRNLRSSPFNNADQFFCSFRHVIGETPSLHEAARRGQIDLVKLLIESGADVDTSDKIGFQALHEAAKNGHKEVAAFLLSHLAKVDSADICGWQPLHWAAKHGHSEVVEFLMDCGAKVNASTPDGLLPLHFAARNGGREVVELLLSKGAKVSSSDRRGNRPIDIAALNGHLEITGLLQIAALNEPLVEAYRDKGCLTRFLDRKPFPIEQSYINLALVPREDYEEVERGSKFLDPLSAKNEFFKNSKRVELAELFNGRSRLYIEGAAGSGKTTLCRFLVSTWANSGSNHRLVKLGPWAHEYETVIFLPLREIRSLSKGASLRDFVLQCYPEFAFDAVSSEKTLFILDGFDEIASLEEVCRSETADQRWKIVENLLRQPNWMMTSRPNLFSERFFRCKRFQNIGFTDENVKAYILRFSDDFKTESLGLERAVFDSQDLKLLVHIPLYLELICSLWKEDPDQISSLNNFAALYNMISTYLFRRHLMRIGVSTEAFDLEEVLNHERIAPLRERLEALAFDSKKLGGNRIGPGIYRPLLKGIPRDMRQFFGKSLFEELGFLTPIEDPKELFKQVYSFIHPTFEEYFAARCLLSQLDSSSADVSSSAAGWLKANCLSKSFEKLIDFTASLADSKNQLNFLAGVLLSMQEPKDYESAKWQFPLIRAAKRGNLKLSASLIENGAKVDAVKNSHWQALHRAAWHGYKEVAALLLKHGAKIDAADKTGCQPVHIAAMNGHKLVVELLLEKGAKVDASDKNGYQPLHFSITSGHKEVANLLLMQGAIVDASDNFGRKPLHRAAEKGHKNLVVLLLERGAKVDASDNNGFQPLHEAAKNNHQNVIELLLERRAKVDASDNDGFRPLHLAAWSGYKDVVEHLLVKGAKVDASDKNGCKPLHFASESGHKEVVELLLAKGAKVDAADDYGGQPLDRAAKFGHKEIVELLLDKGAKVDAVDNGGEQPLHYAAQNGHKEVVELLLKWGAKVDPVDNYGRQPLWMWRAAQNGHKEVVELLLKWGAKVDVLGVNN